MGLSQERQEEQVSVISSLVAFMEPFEDFKVKMWKICMSVCVPKNVVAAYVRTQRRVCASRSVYHVDKSKD